MIQHLFIVAGSCFPNCHPAGQEPVSGVSNSGYAALGLAGILLAIRVALGKRGGS